MLISVIDNRLDLHQSLQIVPHLLLEMTALWEAS